jgi:superfamily II DNA or RNA helicase
MKKLIIILCVAFTSIFAFAATPPTIVQKAFTKMYPNAIKVNWEQEATKAWVAEFMLEEHNCTATFSAYGTWLGTETIISIYDLPLAVSEAIQTRYESWIVRDVYKTETIKHGLIYEADLKKGKRKKEIAFKEDGTMITK